jgi:hypothetical protein
VTWEIFKVKLLEQMTIHSIFAVYNILPLAGRVVPPAV